MMHFQNDDVLLHHFDFVLPASLHSLTGLLQFSKGFPDFKVANSNSGGADIMNRYLWSNGLVISG